MLVRRPQIITTFSVLLLCCLATATAFAQGSYSTAYATFHGGSDHEESAQGAYVDSNGNHYVFGGTKASNTPATGGVFQASHASPGADDGFVAKFNSSGTLLWATFIGGSARDYIHTLVVDSSGDVYVTGGTESTSNFPTTNGALDRTFNGGPRDWFISKISSDGTRLIWSTLLGGPGNDRDRSYLALDASNNVYFMSATTSTSGLPTTGGYDPSHNGGTSEGMDCYIARIASNGASVLSGTYFGSFGEDQCINGLAVRSDGAVVVAGLASSTGVPMVGNGYDTSHNGATDAIFAQFSPDLSSLIWSTYLGGAGEDSASENHGMVLDASNRLVWCGSTNSSNLPATSGAYDTTYNGSGDQDFWCGILSANGQSLIALTYLGQSGNDHNGGAAIDSSGYIYTVGDPDSTNLPLRNQLQSFGGGSNDMYVAKLSPDLRSLVFATYYGGSGEDRGRGIAVHPATGQIFIGGDTESSNFPTTVGAHDRTYAGGQDFALVSFSQASGSVPSPRAPTSLRIIP